MNQTVFITGTSTELGRAAAKLFQASGWNAIATMRSPERETKLTRLENTLVVRLDVQYCLDSITAGYHCLDKRLQPKRGRSHPC